MPVQPSLLALARTTAARWLVLALVALCVPACQRTAAPAPAPSASSEAEEALSRTEFTKTIENFFEYDPLRAGKTSTFLIHLTDLRDGAPVEKADVTVVARPVAGGDATTVKARVGRVTGIYVADVRPSTPGKYEIEFHVRNARLDEKMKLSGFEVGSR